jgi:hypothetical protein
VCGVVDTVGANIDFTAAPSIFPQPAPFHATSYSRRFHPDKIQGQQLAAGEVSILLINFSEILSFMIRTREYNVVMCMWPMSDGLLV